VAKAPLPDTIPGDFFLLTYDRDGEQFTLYVDDAGRSSYNLGSDIPTVMRYFCRIGFKILGDQAIDLAKEFGAAQVIPADERVIRVRPEPQRGNKPDIFNPTTLTRTRYFLPAQN